MRILRYFILILSSFGVSAPVLAQSVEWTKEMSTGTLGEVQIDPLPTEWIAITGDLQRDAFDSDGYVNAISRSNGAIALGPPGYRPRRWFTNHYVDIAARDRDADGLPDYIVAVGNGFREKNKVSTGGGMVDIFEANGGSYNLKHRIEGPAFDQVRAVSLINANNEFFVGASINNAKDTSTRDDAGYDAVVVKYDLNGREIWRDRISNGRLILIHDVVISGSRLYVAGGIEGDLAGTGIPLGEYDGFVRSYDISSGTPVLLWTKRFVTGWRMPALGSYDPGLLSITADNGYNVYIAGWTDRALPNRLPNESDIYRPGSDGALSSFVMKFDAFGTPQWTKQFSTDRETVAKAITTNCGTAIYVGGATKGFFTGENRTGSGTHGGFVVRLNQDGSTAWATSDILKGHHGGSSGAWFALTDLKTMSNSGQLYLSGMYMDNWGPQSTDGQSVRFASVRDTTPVLNIGGNFGLTCPQAPQTPGTCSDVPDRRVIILRDRTSVPHEGFAGSPTCSNNVDDDSDGLCDWEDPDCLQTEDQWNGTNNCLPLGPDMYRQTETGPGSEVCIDGIDNDMDGVCDNMEAACRISDPTSNGNTTRLPSDIPAPALPAPGRTFTPITPPGLGKGTGSASIPSATPQSKSLMLTACKDAVQDKIAWDYKGNKKWSSANLDRLCKGAETSSEPAKCFQQVMHGGVSWGSSTQWSWANAIDLCEGSKNAQSTISCFQSDLKKGQSWSAAIKACAAR